MNIETKIKVGNKLSQLFTPTKGLSQGCCLLPTLFKISINKILKEWKDKCGGMSIDINGNSLYTQLFADDQVVIAGDEYDADYIMPKLTETYNKAGLKVNFIKTKYMVIKSNASNLQIDGRVIDVCNEYKYLRVTFVKEEVSKKEITNRIN